MNNRSSLSASEPVRPNGWHAFGGVWRMTARQWIAPAQLLKIGGLLVALAVPTFAIVDGHDPRRYWQWTAGFYLLFLVPVLGFLSGGAAMREEMKPETVDFLFTRPVRRSVYIAYKFIAHVVCLELCFMLALAILVGVGVYRDVPKLTTALPWVGLAQGLELLAFVGFGFLCAALTSKYIVLGLVYAGIVEFAVGNIPTQINRLAMTHQVKNLLQAIGSENAASKAGQSTGSAALVLLAFAVATVVLGAAIFAQREQVGSNSAEA